MRAVPRLVLVTLAALSLGQAPALTVKGGVITGTVTTPKPARPGDFDAVWVYLEPAKAPRVALGSNVVATIEQKHAQFSPRITVIPLGAKILFPNRDAETHSVFSPAQASWFGFDLGRYSTDPRGRGRKFLELGEFDIFCDIHKDMWAKVKTVPTRHFARVVGGTFTLEDVPPGTYKVVAWTPDNDEVKSPAWFQLEAGGSVEVKALNLQARKRSRDHLRKDGSPYGPYRP